MYSVSDMLHERQLCKCLGHEAAAVCQQPPVSYFRIRQRK